MKAQYMLDTNTVSFLVRGNGNIRAKIAELPIGTCCISAITEAELRFGLAKRPEATQLSIRTPGSDARLRKVTKLVK